MLSLRDCIAMADIPEDKLQELARREHLPLMLAVALAAQRGNELVLPRRGERCTWARQADAGLNPAASVNPINPTAE